MGRGRPVKSEVRQNIIELLSVVGKLHGYDIARLYKKIFPSVTTRNIYYNLCKGREIGEFSVKTVKIEKGEFSWGNHAEKKYYELGPKANPVGKESVKQFFNKNRETLEEYTGDKIIIEN